MTRRQELQEQVRSLHRVGAALAVFTCTLLTSTAVRGQSESAQPREERVFSLTHQSAAEAVGLIYSYLSEAGTVELRPGGNALMVRDTPEAIAKIAELLRDFDRPAQSLSLDIQIVSAGSTGSQAVGDSGLSEELLSRLRKLLRYRSYNLVAKSKVDAAEGREVVSRLGPDYEVDFRIGLVGADRRIKLHGFRVLRRDGAAPAKPLIHTNLNLWLDRPMVLGLARTESSERALMVVLHCTRRESGVEQ